MKDFYYILGLDVNCTADEVREAYRKLSKKFHPDLNQQDNYFENRFKEIRQAYETLIDPAGRAAYDSLLKKSKTQITPQKEPIKNQDKTTKSIDIAFTIMLIVFTLLFGDYVVKTMTGTKPAKPVKAVIADEQEDIPVVKHHKKRHDLFTKQPELITAANITPQTRPIVKPEAKPAMAVSQPLPVTEVKPVIKPQPKPIAAATPVVMAQPVTTFKRDVKPDNVADDDNILTGAYIKANSTGLVYMRAGDNYSSDIVSRIPGNSRIAILEKGANFYKIEYNNKTGYVPRWTVKTD